MLIAAQLEKAKQKQKQKNTNNWKLHKYSAAREWINNGTLTK